MAQNATSSPDVLDIALAGNTDSTPNVIDGVAFAKLYGEPLFRLPNDLYIPPDALEVFLEAFEGPLDLLLYLIRKQNFNILDIPMAAVTKQYLEYVDQIRVHNLELAAESNRACCCPSEKPIPAKKRKIRALSWYVACLNTNK